MLNPLNPNWSWSVGPLAVVDGTPAMINTPATGSPWAFRAWTFTVNGAGIVAGTRFLDGDNRSNLATCAYEGTPTAATIIARQSADTAREGLRPRAAIQFTQPSRVSFARNPRAHTNCLLLAV